MRVTPRLGWSLLLMLSSVTPFLVSSGGAAASNAPVVTSISPSAGPTWGTVQVSILGSGFWCGGSQPDPATTIRFGATPVAFGTTLPTGEPLVHRITDKQILVKAPSSPTPGPVNVTVDTSCGTSANSPSAVFTYQPECGGTCAVQVDALDENGAADRLASGIVAGVRGGWTNETAKTKTIDYLNALRPARWRTGFTNTTVETTHAVFNALSPQPALEVLLESGWLSATGHFPPWRDDYVTWERYVTAMVSGHEFCGPNACVPAPPPAASWDVWNEPITNAMYMPEGTVQQYLELLRHTYNTIKGVDPNANIVAPSVTAMLDYVPTGFKGSGQSIDLVTLLHFASEHNLHFDAYSFHDVHNGETCAEAYPNDEAGCPAYPINSPTLLADHVNRVRNLLDQYPDLLPADIEVNEFGSPALYDALPSVGANSLIPGWQAGFIAALEQENARGYLSCWTRQYKYLNLLPKQWSECDKGVDGLMMDNQDYFQPNQAQANATIAPEAIYWVYQFYNGMSGTRVATSTAHTDLSAYATRDEDASTVKVLIGRHKRCSTHTRHPRNDPACPAGGPSVTVPIQVAWPYPDASVAYTLQRVPNTGNGFGGRLATLPSPTVGRADVVGGVATVTVPSFADGQAYTLTVARP